MDSVERVHVLDPETLELFAAKGSQAQAEGPRTKVARFNPNVVKVRRVMQLTRDWTRRPFSDLRILDLACGEGVFAIEAGLRGARGDIALKRCVKPCRPCARASLISA